MAILLVPKGYKGLTCFQPLDDILFWLKSLGSAGMGEKWPSKGGELLAEIETSGPGYPLSDELYQL